MKPKNQFWIETLGFRAGYTKETTMFLSFLHYVSNCRRDGIFLLTA